MYPIFNMYKYWMNINLFLYYCKLLDDSYFCFYSSKVLRKFAQLSFIFMNICKKEWMKQKREIRKEMSLKDMRKLISRWQQIKEVQPSMGLTV
jgi:hypothetical protein